MVYIKPDNTKSKPKTAVGKNVSAVKNKSLLSFDEDED
jgi:hypothetical protein